MNATSKQCVTLEASHPSPVPQWAKAQRELISLERRIKNSKEELEQDSAIRSNELRVKLVKIVNEVIQELAKSENLDLVVNENVVVYVNDRIDITDKVSDRLKRKFKSDR